MKKFFYVFLLFFTFIMFNGVGVSAKTSSNDVFEVSVGDESLPLSYNLVESKDVLNSNDEIIGYWETNIISLFDGKTYTISSGKILDDNGEEIGDFENDVITLNNGDSYTLGDLLIKERIQFNVSLKGVSESSNSYKWEHKLCYKIVGGSEICEFDITGDVDSTNKILSDNEYSYYFYDGHMPYYSDSLEFEYVTFKNNFVCLDCESYEEFSLNDISFVSNEINYKYSYGINVSNVENNSKKYVNNYSSNGLVYVKALFVNNSGSSLILKDSPTYKIINEVCVEDDNCVSQEIDKVYSSSDTNNKNPFSITPYLGNMNFYYYGSNLPYVNNEIPYEFAIYKTTLVCLTNCDSRRVENSIVLGNEKYYFDYTKPSIDTENTIINSYDEIEYIKNSEVKITVEDAQSGIDSSKLKYYIVTPYSNSCLWGSTKEYSFVNGESFVIGDGLNGGYCMYYVAYDKNGNYYQSDYYVYYFDNSSPLINFENSYDTDKYYNEVNIDVRISDNYSGIKEVYYLWSKEIIGKDDFNKVKVNGKLYESSISSVRDINEDGKYYLYFLGYDNLDNYKLYDLGSFNIDTEGLTKNEINVETTGFSSSYINNGTITINVDEIVEGEEFKCGFFTSSSVQVSELNDVCYNKQIIDIKNGLEGEYNFFIYIKDRANNYSLIKVLENLKVDTKAPRINVDVLYDDDNYHLVNEITLNVSDLNEVNYDSLKYGWFLKNKDNVLSSDLDNMFVSGEKFGYPRSYYGEYKLYVSAKDILGNEVLKTFEKVFKIDTDVIRISLNGEYEVTILKGEKYEDLGAKAYKGDVLTGGRISEMNIEGNVNTKKPGVYYITYSSGEGDLLVSVTRKVVVKNDFSYIISFGSLFVLGAVITSIRLFIRRKRT